MAAETGHFSVNFQPVTDAFLSYSKLLHNSDFFTLCPHFHYLLQPIKDNGSKYQQPQRSTTYYKRKTPVTL